MTVVWLLLVTGYSGTIRSSVTVDGKQNWSQGQKALRQGQGHKKKIRAKHSSFEDRPSRGQGQK